MTKEHFLPHLSFYIEYNEGWPKEKKTTKFRNGKREHISTTNSLGNLMGKSFLVGVILLCFTAEFGVEEKRQG